MLGEYQYEREPGGGGRAARYSQSGKPRHPWDAWKGIKKGRETVTVPRNGEGRSKGTRKPARRGRARAGGRSGSRAKRGLPGH